MRTFCKILACAFAIAALSPCAPAQTTDTVDSIVTQEMRARRIPGVAIAVVENGLVTLERAYGTANLETETPLRTDAVFELASVTKQFTAAAIMMLVEEGKVALDEPIATYIDGTPEAWKAITVRQLLTHTGGLEISGLPAIAGSAPLNITTLVAFDYVAGQQPRFPPGREGWYSDAGYFLLGMIVEKAAGESYREFMQHRVFEPLQMSQSSILDKSRVLKGRVPTYSIRSGELVNWRRDWDYELPSFFGIFSTLRDLAKWDASLRNATLLEKESLEQMWTPAKVSGGNPAYVLDAFYGFGFELADLRGRRTAGHGGASGTYILRFLDEPLTIIVLTNLDMPSGRRHPVFLAQAIAGALRPELAPPELLSGGTDPAPEVTRTLESLLADIAADRTTSMFSPAYARWWATAFGRRAVMRNQLRGVGPLTYVGYDDVASRRLWDPEPLARLVYYRATVEGRTQHLTVGLTSDGKVARLSIPFQPAP